MAFADLAKGPQYHGLLIYLNSLSIRNQFILKLGGRRGEGQRVVGGFGVTVVLPERVPDAVVAVKVVEGTDAIGGEQ